MVRGLPLCCVCLLTLIGCAVGPDYHPPKADVPQAWAGPASQPSTVPAGASPVDLSRWWTSFNDPMLTSLVRQSVRANKDVLLAESRIRQAQASRDVAAAALFPALNAIPSFTRSQSPGVTPAKGADAKAGPVKNAWQVGLSANWNLDVFGGIRRNIEATEADLQAAEDGRQAVILTLVSEVASDYISLRGFQREIVIAKENLKTQQHTANLTRQKGTLVSKLDIANADAQVATTAATIPPLETAARQEIYSLAVLLGKEPEALLAELSAEAPIPPVPPQVPTDLPSALLRRRPDIRQAEAQIHGATARVGVATAALFPQFSLTASAGYQSDMLSKLTRSNAGLWSFGPSMDWQLFDGLGNLANVDVQKALQEQSVLTYEKTILTALQDVESALVAYANEQEHRKVLLEAVRANREASDLSVQSYTQGLTDFLTVLVAQRSLYTAEDALVQSTASVSNDLVALYLALGGGWEDQPAAGQAASMPSSQPAAAAAK